jgi:exonuclease III
MEFEHIYEGGFERLEDTSHQHRAAGVITLIRRDWSQIHNPKITVQSKSSHHINLRITITNYPFYIYNNYSPTGSHAHLQIKSREFLREFLAGINN